MNINGTLVNYYVHCKRQCYLAHNNINLEGNSELVKIGKELHEEKAKKNKMAEIKIDNICLDKISVDYITEIKKSDADIDAATMQLKYYMYILNKKGIIRDGKIEVIEKNNKANKKIIIIKNDENIKKEIESLLEEMENFFNGNIPDADICKKCKKCAYYEYCVI